MKSQFSAYQINDKIVVRFVDQEENKTLEELGISSIRTLDDDVLFDNNSSGNFSNEHIEFITENTNGSERLRYVKIVPSLIQDFIPTKYVNLFPRDMKVYLSLMQQVLKSNDKDLIKNIQVKRGLVRDLEQLKFSITSIEEFEDLLLKIESQLESINEDEYFINLMKNCTLAPTPFQPLLEVCKRANEEVKEVFITAENLPKNAIDPSLINSERVSHVDTISSKNKINLEKSESATQNNLFNIPTGRGDSENKPIRSPLFGAEPFTMMMYRMEELHTLKFAGPEKEVTDKMESLNGYPIEETLPSLHSNGFPDHLPFLGKINQKNNPNIGYLPTKQSNTTEENPWKEDIKRSLNPENRERDHPWEIGNDFKGTAEGRPGGINGEHLIWENPQTMVNTCIGGILTSSGFRDSGQRHRYSSGEFGPGGLYHRVMEFEKKNGSITFIDGTTKGIPGKFHMLFPDQEQESLWTFDGTFPPKLLQARYGEPVIMRNYNMLSIDPSTNKGFGLHTISIHEHNGHTNSISDGYAQTYFFPGQYYDYLFPMAPSGFKTINIDKLDPRSSGPGEWEKDSEGNDIIVNGKKLPGENIPIAGPYHEIMSTHWFHDHMLDFTAQNVYKGSVGTMNYYSGIDRGNEEIDDGVNLRFPSGTSLAWGNRDYDVYMLLADKAWDEEGQLWFNPFNTNGFLGDRNLVNWVFNPYFKVRSRRYRLRLLNGAVSRWYKYALVHLREDVNGEFAGETVNGVISTSYDRVPFHMIGNDGNIMAHAINFDGSLGTTKGTVPTQAIGERFDIIVDFGKFKDGDKLYFVNVLEHMNGKKPSRVVPLGDILNGDYNFKIQNNKGDPCVEKFLEFRVMKYEGIDLSMDPADYEYLGRKMIDIIPVKKEEIKHSIYRRFDFVNHIDEDGQVLDDEWAIEINNDGITRQMDPRLIAAAPSMNSGELWHLVNAGDSWAHNVHIHFTEGRILLRDNKIPPIWEQFSRKDVYRIGGADGGDGSNDMLIFLYFKDTPGTYMMHCHNTTHEDHAMLLRWDIEERSCEKNGLPTHLPTWNGVEYMETLALPTFRSGMHPSNDEYKNPRSIVNRLLKLNRTVPDSHGNIWVDGLGHSIESKLFKPTEGRTNFSREPLSSKIRGTGGFAGAGNSQSAGSSVVTVETPVSLSDLCACDREALTININGTGVTNAWFDGKSNLNECHVIKFKQGDVITISSSTSQKHGGILKVDGVGTNWDNGQDLSDFDLLLEFLESSDVKGHPQFLSVFDIDTTWPPLSSDDELDALEKVEVLQTQSQMFKNFGGTNNIGIVFRSKANDNIAKLTVKEGAQGKGAWICTVHGVSMSFLWEICEQQQEEE